VIAVLARCRTVDNVTWLDAETTRFQFRLSRELMSEASFVNVECDVSLCRDDNTPATALPQV